MKHWKVRRLLIAVVMLIAAELFSLPSSATCADDACGRANQVACIEQALQNLQGCIGSPGYCADQFDRDYTGCMVLKGCANPPPPVL